MRYRVTNLTRNTLLADRAGRADTFARRLKGLMGVTTFAVGDGLHFEPCTGIHTFFMRIPIDALFLDGNLEVVAVCHALVPWRVSPVYLGARSVLELPAGTTRASSTQTGDRLCFETTRTENLPLRADGQLAD
jgi:uncharacterized membrane protein (UPF0127 family)